MIKGNTVHVAPSTPGLDLEPYQVATAVEAAAAEEQAPRSSHSARASPT